MRINSSVWSLSLLVLCICLYASLASAQVTTFIGTSAFSKEKFSCVTYPGGEDIKVTKKGKNRILDKKEAKRLAQNSMQGLSRETNDTKALLKENRELVKKLLKSPTLVLPSTSNKLEKAKKAVIKLEAKLERLAEQKAQLKALIMAINDCGKPYNPQGSNSLQISYVDLPLTKRTGYLIAALHVFPFPPGSPDRLCVSVNGGPKTYVGTRTVVGTTFYDGSGFSHPIHFADGSAIGPGRRAIVLGIKAGHIESQTFDDDLSAVTAAMSTTIDLSVLSEDNPC